MRQSHARVGSRAILVTWASGWTLLVRLMVGLVVFFPEGLQKLLFPAILGAGRFAKIGIPWPEVLAPFVGVTETICGALIVVGFLTRLAAIPLIVIMVVAIVSTKVPILLGRDFWLFHVPQMSRYGFWSMLHEARADLDMLLGCIYLLIVGGGRWSLDAWISSREQHPPASAR
ncbi:MAG TPA: DoxX family protein [Steroidobacteraceae bacterium]|nr:DoxX family protein [Steroidobacteraceae bacterium]